MKEETILRDLIHSCVDGDVDVGNFDALVAIEMLLKSNIFPLWPKDIDLSKEKDIEVIVYHLGRLSMAIDIGNRGGYTRALSELRATIENDGDQ